MWKLLFNYLFSPRADDEPVDDPVDEEVIDDEPVDDEPALPDDDVQEPLDDDEPAPRVSKAQKAIIETRRRAQEAEEQVRRLQADLDNARRAPSQPQQPSQDQVIWQQEEEVLRSPEASDWQRYAVQSARAARQATATSKDALHRAEDLADRTRFEQLKATKPKLYEAYGEKVETQLAELRKQGINVPREKLLAIQIGEDMLAGKLKSASATKKVAAPRGNTPGARSDVNSSGGKMSDAEKRAKRLENIRI